jgi:hypothetical protein
VDTGAVLVGVGEPLLRVEILPDQKGVTAVSFTQTSSAARAGRPELILWGWRSEWSSSSRRAGRDTLPFSTFEPVGGNDLKHLKLADDFARGVSQSV